jgi:hypothetical protein
MLDISATALNVVTRSFTMAIRAESWLGDQLLAADIPVSDGSESRDRSLAVPEQISLTVPRRDRGTSWDPTSPDGPLAAYGQQLRIGYGVDVGGSFEYINRGTFPIASSDTTGDTVTVTCEGLLSLIVEAKLPSVFQPSGTLMSTVQALVEPALTVQFDAALTDRAVPLGMQWDNDRMNALQEVVAAFPAACRVTENGILLVEPVIDTGTPVLALTDGTGGTVVKWQGGTTRDGAFNTVIAQGQDASSNQLTGVAYDLNQNSPYYIGGPFSPLVVPNFYSSPLLTTVAQCTAAAQTRLQTLRRTNSRTLKVTMVPHPGLVTGDFVSITSVPLGLNGVLCSIETMALPYGPGEMDMTVRVLAGG